LSFSPSLSRAKTFDVVIVGGGIIGLLAARELQLAGASVAIVDRGPIGRESSWAGGGILSPLYPWRYPEAVTRLAAWSQQAYPQLVQELLQKTGIDAEYQRSGLLIFPEKDRNSAVKWSENHGNSIELVHVTDAAALQPGLTSDGNSWLWMPGVGQVRNPRLISAISALLLKEGVEFIENSAISNFIIESGRFRGLESESGSLQAGQCLVASGAWSGGLIQQLGLSVPIEPVQGQMLLLKGSPGLLRRIVLKDSHYLIPRVDGRILVGSTLEHVGFAKKVTDTARQELLAAATDIFPELLAKTEIETQWAGLRPGSPEGIPYIGPHPDIEGLYLCSGHFRNGFVLGPASARLVAEVMLQQRPILDTAPYRLVR
jgi:glycine oxidase